MIALSDVVRHFRFRSGETKSSYRGKIEDHYLERRAGGEMKNCLLGTLIWDSTVSERSSKVPWNEGKSNLN